ncbi:MAG TPA: flavin reductase family protein [Bryobacteraceae bacterium]|nr:flavin reductase family protein [Bryobacteraceae bacterium]
MSSPRTMQAVPSVDPLLFRKACGRFATGVAIATVRGPDSTPYGLTINSFTSVSCCPPLVLICVDYRSSLLPIFRSSSWYGLNFLEESQRPLADRFSQRQPDRFEALDWAPGQTGVPLLAGCLGSMECAVSQTVEAGDHAILLGEVVAAEWREGRPLLYYGSSYKFLASD